MCVQKPIDVSYKVPVDVHEICLIPLDKSNWDCVQHVRQYIMHIDALNIHIVTDLRISELSSEIRNLRNSDAISEIRNLRNSDAISEIRITHEIMHACEYLITPELAHAR